MKCELDPELMFSVDPNDEARAKAVCLDCPIRTECLEQALTMGEDYGVWGGMTADERRTLRRRELERRQLVFT